MDEDEGGRVSDVYLFGARESGHSYKVKLFLCLAGIEHGYREIDLSVPRGERPPEFRKHARFGEVPVLIHGEQVLVQSNAILLHLARYFGVFRPQTRNWEDDAASWLFWEANRIGRSIPNLRYCRLFSKNADPALVAWFEQTAIEDIDRLNHELATKPFILETFTITDLSCAAYLLYDDDFGIDLKRWPYVSAWLDRIRAMNGWRHPRQLLSEETTRA